MLSEEQLLSLILTSFYRVASLIKKNKVTMETQKHLSVFSSLCLFLTLLNLMNGSSHVEKKVF